jgi:hypothetical protein
VQKTSRTTVLDQAHTHNHVNEIDVDDNHSNSPGASITTTSAANWFDPSAAAAGQLRRGASSVSA